MHSTHTRSGRWAGARKARILQGLSRWLTAGVLSLGGAGATPGPHTPGPVGPAPRARLAVEVGPAPQAADTPRVEAGPDLPDLPDLPELADLSPGLVAQINACAADALPFHLSEVLAQLALTWGVRSEDGERIEVPEAEGGDDKRRWLAATLDKHRLQLLRDSCAVFMKHGLGMAVGPHHAEWSRLLMRHAKVSILAARGHGKSAFWSYAFPLWRCWRAPSTSGLLISNTDDQTQRFFRIIKEGKRFTDAEGVVWDMPAAASVPLLQAIIPADWERAWTGHRIFFTNRSHFAGATFGKRFRGAHVDWIVVDDPIDDAAQFSKRVREKAHAFYTRAISPMLQPSAGALLACIGTPLHEDDLHARLAANPEYLHRRYPGIATAADGTECPLWPALRSSAWHRSKRLELGELAYAQEILLKPISAATSLFPPELFSRRPETLQRTLRLGQWTQADLRALGHSVYMGVDVAISAEVGADYMVIVVASVDANKNRYLIDLVRLHGQPFEAQLAEIHRVAKRYGISLGYIEANQMQVLYAAHFANHTDLPIRPFVTGRNKNDLVQGVLGLRPLFENGKWRFPQGDERSVTEVQGILDEFRDFSIVDDKLQGMGNHDDRVMALWICEQACRAGSIFGWGGLNEEDVAPPPDLAAWLAHVPAGLPEATRITLAEQLAAEAGVGVPPPPPPPPPPSPYDDDRPVPPTPKPPVPGPRLNVHTIPFRHASPMHPEGTAGVRHLARGLPAEPQALITAFNVLNRSRPDLAQLNAECYAIAVEHGPELLLAILRDALAVP